MDPYTESNISNMEEDFYTSDNEFDNNDHDNADVMKQEESGVTISTPTVGENCFTIRFSLLWRVLIKPPLRP